MNNPMDRKPNQNNPHLILVDACPPPLTAGKYTLRATQTIATPQGPDDFVQEKTFWVSAPRFTLDPAEIYAVYPPADHVGEYHTSLPHIVLTRKTLPWERTLDGTPLSPAERVQHPPWLALLLFDEDELTQHAIQPKTVELRQLRAPEEANTRGPRLTPEPWDDDKASCTVLDVPATLLQKMLPTAEELCHLAHARQVDVQDKELAEGVTEGWFSVVLGNRLPSQGKPNTVFLVSLEGWSDLLQAASQPVDASAKARLVVLTQWGFTAAGDDFLTVMRRLGDGAQRLRVMPGSTPANPTVETALALGYTALTHTTRQGETTVSWYRGPLVPLSLPKLADDLHDSADAALMYDDQTGLFDVSYAAAWQLGRLLGLQKREFGDSLQHWKSDYIQQETLALAKRLLEEDYQAKYRQPFTLIEMDEVFQDDLMLTLLLELWVAHLAPEV
jgi:hypothetical protein